VTVDEWNNVLKLNVVGKSKYQYQIISIKNVNSRHR